ncbi:MAG: BatD family protein [Verrucomicrobia bacterium]|nr:BatD family protein [Verrucomicrobiota bacterium]
MKPSALGVIIGLLLVHSASSARAALTLDVSVDREQIFIGDSIRLTVSVAGAQNIPEPDLSAIRDCQIRPLGNRTRNEMRMETDANGRLTRTSFFGHDFTYDIVPTRTGRVLVGPVRIHTEDGSLVARGTTVQVQGEEKQDWILLEIATSRDTVLVDEPFEITATVLLRRLRHPYHDHDPLDPRHPPMLSIPFLQSAFPEGLEGPDIQAWLQQALVSKADQPGFGINNNSVQPRPFDNLFSMGSPFERQIARFTLPKRATTREGRDYFAYDLRLVLTPRQQGRYTFGPISLRGAAVTDVDAGGQLIKQPVLSHAPAVRVNVIRAPEEGQPANYIGAVGSDLALSAALDTQTCKVGDPLTLTLSLSGALNFDNVSTPILSQHADFGNHFRVYDDTARTQIADNGRTYTYTIRPTQVGTYEFPAIGVSYFDTTKRAYQTVYSSPIPIRANRSTELASDMIISTATNRTSQRILATRDVELTMAPLTMDPSGADFVTLGPRRHHWLLGLAGPVLWLFAIVVAISSRWIRRLYPGGRHRHLRIARRRLQQLAADADYRTVCQVVSETIRQYLVGRFGVGSGISPADLPTILHGCSLSSEAVMQFQKLYQTVFDAGFGGATASATCAELVRQTIASLESLDAASRQSRKAGS